MRFSATEIIEGHWQKQRSLQRSEGATAQEIDAFQKRYGVILPEDFATYLRMLNGLATPKDANSWENIDQEGFAFYPLSSISPVPQCPNHYVFCYWTLGLLPLAICLSHTERNGEVVSLRGEPSTPHFVAPNFSSFAELYVQDSPLLYQLGAVVHKS